MVSQTAAISEPAGGRPGPVQTSLILGLAAAVGVLVASRSAAAVMFESASFLRVLRVVDEIDSYEIDSAASATRCYNQAPGNPGVATRRVFGY